MPEDQRVLLKFFWWDDSNLTAEPVKMEMNVHLFGASSSPPCANFALRKTALDNTRDFSNDVVESVLRNFYADDNLQAAPDICTGQRLIAQISEICSRGGFHLTKFVATEPELLKHIPREDVAHDESRLTLKDKSQDCNSDTEGHIEYALGVVWTVINDGIEFKMTFWNRPDTRRRLLAAISSVWDVLVIRISITIPAQRS